MPQTTEITPDRIVAAEALIRPHIRHTPVMTVAMEDFGLKGGALDLKLECLQHSGSFKARGAFTNLLTRDVRRPAWSRHRAAIMARRSPMRR